jgi:hypothetical protein
LTGARFPLLRRNLVSMRAAYLSGVKIKIT